jgi:hypothetical protein
MKLVSFASVVAVSVSVAVPPIAGQQTFEVDARAGWAVPTGALADFARAGPSYALGVSYWLSDRLAVRVEGAFDDFRTRSFNVTTPEQEAFFGVAPGPRVGVRVWHYTAGLRFGLTPPGARLALDAKVGLGLARTATDATTGALSDPLGSSLTLSETHFDPAANGGLQLAYRLDDRLQVFAGAELRAAFGASRDPGDTFVVRPFGTMLTVPTTAGFRMSLP